MSAGIQKVRVGISVGDLNGIGMEIILKSLQDSRIFNQLCPVVYGSSKLSSFYRKHSGLHDFQFHLIKDAAEAHPKRPNLVQVWEEEVTITPGKASEQGGIYAFKSLEAAVSDLKAGKIDVLVTAPIDKHSIQSEQFPYPGHTEYLAQAFDANALMLMVSDTLKVALVTGHLPVHQVAGALETSKIAQVIEALNQTLIQDFATPKPKIAVLGLNPHAGDQGLLGKEEQEVIMPAIQQAQESGILAYGPFPADGFFGSGSYVRFDAVVAMYHDQGLIPFKALVMDEGVNFTAGLPYVRTSPDHGTGYDIAGHGKARPDSFLNALYKAVDIYRRRSLFTQLSANALQPQMKKSRDYKSKNEE